MAVSTLHQKHMMLCREIIRVDIIKKHTTARKMLKLFSVWSGSVYNKQHRRGISVSDVHDWSQYG